MHAQRAASTSALHAISAWTKWASIEQERTERQEGQRPSLKRHGIQRHSQHQRQREAQRPATHIPKKNTGSGKLNGRNAKVDAINANPR